MAASVIALRGEPFEVLLMRRNARSSFVPGAWVFPGGTLDPGDREVAKELGDGSELATMRVCAARELFEEAGVWLGDAPRNAERRRAELLRDPATFRALATESVPELDRLVWTSRWITPVGVPKRFDTYFFLATVASDTDATPELQEGMEMIWLRPEEALERHWRDELPLVFPTIKNLEALTAHSSSKALLDSRVGAVIEPILPVLTVGEDGAKTIRLPGES